MGPGHVLSLEPFKNYSSVRTGQRETLGEVNGGRGQGRPKEQVDSLLLY